MTREELYAEVEDIVVHGGGQSVYPVDSIMNLVDEYVSTLPQTKWMKDNKIIFNQTKGEAPNY